MSAMRQLLAGIIAGAVVVALVAGGLVLSAGDAAIALLPSATFAPDTPTATPEPVRPSDTPTQTPTLVPTSTCPRPPGWLDYVVQPGDDLASIAQRFNIAPAILQVNNCLNDPAVSPGQAIFVPPVTPTPSPTATAFTPFPTSIPCGPPIGWVTYIVKPGDTLSSIARATGTTVEMLKFANCLVSDVIKAGQPLFVPRLPVPTPTRTPFPTFTPTSTSTVTPSTTPTPTPTTPVVTPPTLPPSDTPTGTPSETPVIIQTPTPSPTIDATPTPTETFLPPADAPTTQPAP